MITKETIERIKSLSISQVIGHFLPLKRAGANYTAPCPFHHEKSASFTVNDVKDIYKCFGCGKSGNAIGFVMDHQNKSFVDAIKTIADANGITIEYEPWEPTEKEKENYTQAQLQEQVLNYVIPEYQKQLHGLPANHPVKKWLADRGFDQDTIDKWQLGWAGAEWKFLTSTLINKGFFEPANKLGIIKRSQTGDSNYDGYRSRITFPITDKNGRFIGLAGRYVKVDENDTKEVAKYINPADCEIYHKSTVLYGLSEAAKAIQEKNMAYLVEGYADVISPWSAGIKNVVATCGTAFTPGQIQLLKKYTPHVAVWRDNDAAGINSTVHAVKELLKEGFKVEVVKYDEKDPDEWVQKTKPTAPPPSTDAILWFAKLKTEEAGDNMHSKADAKKAILEVVGMVSNEILRNNYIDTLCNLYKWKKADTKKEFSTLDAADVSIGEESTTSIKFPEWMKADMQEEFMRAGYVPVNRKVNGKPMVGYYSFTQNGKSEITNFIVSPLFHVYAGVESRYLLQIYNGYRYAVLDIPAKVIPSIDQFQGFTVSEGNFLIFGAKPQWLRIASDLLQNFPRCMEVGSLGWQNFSFFAWVDKIFVPGEGLKDLDNWGIIKINNGKEEQSFLIPASCEAYRQLQRTGDDPYENDRYLTFKPTTINFATWAVQMQKVYMQKGIVGVAYAILTIFRDLVFDVDNNCPHLYGFGEPSSGKSKWAESITALFYYKRAAFNLNSGTDFAFFNYMQRYRNCPAHLNEFEIEVIKPEWFQSIKGIYDGESRERGKGGSKNRTEVMRVHSTLILTGQKLVTSDDNSVVTRSLIEPFSTRDDITEQEKQDYDTLKDWESTGLSAMLAELLQHRPYFEKHYKNSFNAILSQWRKKEDTRQLNQRILQNYAHLCCCYSLMAQFITLPQAAADFNRYCYQQAIKWSKFIRSSDTLSEFWRTLEFLVDQNQVIEGWDYTIETCTDVKVRNSKDGETAQHFTQPTRVLFIRLNNIHKLFQSAFRSRTGKEAMNQDNLLHYFSSRKYYIGPVKSKMFKRFVNSTEHKQYGIETLKKAQEQKSSCYAFLYDDLGIEIDRFDGNAAPEEAENYEEIPTF